jgi:ribonucleoside-diphosphate reductase alpha chain
MAVQRDEAPIGMSQKMTEFSRPKVLTGVTTKVRLDHDNLYVTVNREPQGKIVEVFCTLGKAGSNDKASAEALGRLISVALQNGTNVEDLAATLKGIRGREVSYDNGKEIWSVPDAIGQVLGALIESDRSKTKLAEKSR